MPFFVVVEQPCSDATFPTSIRLILNALRQSAALQHALVSTLGERMELGHESRAQLVSLLWENLLVPGREVPTTRMPVDGTG